MEKQPPLQEQFLDALRREKVPVSVFMVNGIRLQGTIARFDNFIIILKNVTEQVVYKHAISTILPSRNVQYRQTSEADEQTES